MRFADLAPGLVAVLALSWTAVLALLVPARGLAARLRRPAVAVGSAIAVLLLSAHALVVDAVEDRAGLATWDGPVLSRLVADRTGPVSTIMTAASAAGGTLGMTVLAVILTAALWWRGRRGLAAVLAVAALGAAGLTTAFKHLYARARPPAVDQLVPESSFALPSGHSVGSVVVLGTVVVIAVLLARRVAARVAAVAAGLAGVLVIGASRLYLGVHWLTDVVAGWALGGAWLAVCAAAAVIVHGRSGSRARGAVVAGPPGRQDPERARGAEGGPVAASHGGPRRVAGTCRPASRSPTAS